MAIQFWMVERLVFDGFGFTGQAFLEVVPVVENLKYDAAYDSGEQPAAATYRRRFGLAELG